MMNTVENGSFPLDDSKFEGQHKPSGLSTAYAVPAKLEEGCDESAVPFAGCVWGRGQQLAHARAAYFNAVIPGVLLVTLVIFAVFSVLWGALWQLPAHALPGWIVDFDGGDIGQAVIQGLTALPQSTIRWSVVSPGEFAGGVMELADAVKEERTWVAVSINEGTTRRLESAMSTPNASYDGAAALTVFAVEARNENAYRDLLYPVIQTYLPIVTLNISIGIASRLSSADNLASLLSVSPQMVVSPISYQFVNLLPFSQPVATATTSTGLIFMLIMAFFVVTISNTARMTSGFARLLTLRSLITFRLLSSFVTYLFLSLCYALLNLAFQLDMRYTFGNSGFVVFWMGAWVYMLAVGLALESLIVLLKQFVVFFLITWIVVNVSINLFPLEMLPRIFHYGYGAPFYSFSKIIRTVVFGTKNDVGLHFGILVAWAGVSCVTLSLIQWRARRQEVCDMEQKMKMQRM